MSMDLLTTDPKNYAIIVDLYSDVWEVDDIQKAMSSTVNNSWKFRFSPHDIPGMVLIDDNLISLHISY